MSVHIRNVRGKLYLDIYSNGRRKWESLGLRLEGDAKQDAETWRLAKLARSIREQQLFSKEWNLLDPIAGKKKFEDYCKEKTANVAAQQACIAMIDSVMHEVAIFFNFLISKYII